MTGVSARLAPCDGTRLQLFREDDAGNEFRGHDELAFDLARVIERHDIRVQQLRVDFDLAKKASVLFLVVLNALGQDFQNFKPLRKDISYFISDAGFGSAEYFDNLIACDRLADFKSHFSTDKLSRQLGL